MQQVKKNAQALASALLKRKCRFVTDATDNHLLLWDLTALGLIDFQENYKVLKKRKLQEYVCDTSNENDDRVKDDTIESDTFKRTEDDITTEHGLNHQEELSLWVEVVSGPKKGRIYTLGS